MPESKTILLPDVGDFDDIEVIEVLVAAGDEVAVDDSLITLESDKATMEIPSPFAGIIESVTVKVGERISKGSLIANISSEESATEAAPVVEEAPAKAETPQQESPPVAAPVPAPSPTAEMAIPAPAGESHASPSVRKFARELGVDLSQIGGSGRKGRISKEDVQSFVKGVMQSGGGAPASGGLNVGAAPKIDFSKFGEIETVDLSRIKKLSGAHLHRSWVTVPHVTQFDEADITELEAFRKSLGKEAEKAGVRLTPLVFILKAVVAALKAFPEVNASLDPSGEQLILKQYFHIGVAVDTPNGLVVPVIRDVDQKGIFELAAELAETAATARAGKLSPAQMQGGCFSVSSLGGIGGTQFTPIINAPEVAILGVSRSKMTPVYQQDGSFEARNMLPLSLSYDHRVIDGAQGARFTRYLAQVISDLRRSML